MNGQKSPSEIIRKLMQFFLAIIYFILLAIISIGDAVQLFFRSVIAFFSATYIISFRVLTELRDGITHWIREKINLFSAKQAPIVPGQPRLPRLKLKFPKIKFPRLGFFTFTLKRKPRQGKVMKEREKYLVVRRERLSFWSIPSLKSFFAGIFITVLFIFIPFNTYLWLAQLPNPQILGQRDIEVTSKIYDRSGTLLYEIYGNENRTPVPFTQIPQYVKDATIAIEDRDFYRHQGFSIRGIARAARETIFKKQLQGGSTITQQLIKSALLTPDINLSRKIKEIILAFWAERIYTKDQILEMYFNQVPYGGTAWGIEAASQTYFGKSIRDVTLGEAALLAGLPAAPTEYSPFGNNPDKSIERQHLVLNRMLEDGYITRDQAEKAAAQPLAFTKQRIPIRAPHFVMYIRQLLEEKYGPRLVAHGGLRIKTSLDIALQEKTEDIVKNEVKSLAALRVGNGAAVVTNPQTGEVLAMIGSKDYFDTDGSGNVNVATSHRQPGSSIKVVNYAAALERGFTAASVLDDSPITFPIAGSSPYTPVNYDGRFHGFVPLRYALGNSYNIPAVKVLAKIGVDSMLDKGSQMGINSWNDRYRYGLSLTLGGGEVTMLEMSEVYGTLANLGKRIDLLPILEVTDYTGRVLERNSPKGVQAVSREVAWIMGNILSDNTARIAAFGPNSLLVIPGKTVSVKTGTTNEKRDNWTIGYTPSVVVVVWVGNNDNSPMNPVLTSGVTGAAPIWHAIMSEILKDKPDEVTPKPETVLAVPCYFGRPEYFVKGTEPPAGRCSPLPSPSPSATPGPR